MKPKRHPSERAKAIVFLDANMPSVRDCGHGCTSNAKYMCRHRFGPRIWVSDRPKTAVPVGRPAGTPEKPFNRFKDLEVVLWWVDRVRHRWADRKGIVQAKRYVLATHDVDFIVDVHEEYQAALHRGYDGPPLTFSGRKDPRTGKWVDAMTQVADGKVGWVQSGTGKQAVRLEIFNLGRALSRDHDLRTVVTHCRQLRKKEPLRPH